MSGRTRTRLGVAFSVVILPALIAVACTTTLSGGLAIVTGPDNGFIQNPQPASIVMQLINTDGAPTTVAEASLLSGPGLSVPPLPGDAVDIIQFTGFDDAGTAVVSGTTIPVALDQISGITLNVFVQRTGQFSRLPSAEGGGAAVFSWTAEAGGGGLSANPILTTIYSRYTLIADGTGKSTSTQMYDTLTWQLLAQPPSLSIPPLSLAYVDQYTGTDAATDAMTAALLTIGANNQANWLYFANNTSPEAGYAEASLPPTAPGVTFNDVAGGQTVLSTGGNAYVVGPTRPGPLSRGVLRISASGVFSWVDLNSMRTGAAAAYASGGILIFGGSAPGDAGPDASLSDNGVEFVSDELANEPVATNLGTLPFDTTQGAGAVAFNPDNNPALPPPMILLAGGVTPDGASAPTRFYPLAGLLNAGMGSDGGDGGMATWPALPVALVTAQVFAIGGSSATNYSAVVVGTTAQGVTLAYLLTPTTPPKPLSFQATRTHGKAALLANGSLAVVGGNSGTIESFIP